MTPWADHGGQCSSNFPLRLLLGVACDMLRMRSESWHVSGRYNEANCERHTRARRGPHLDHGSIAGFIPGTFLAVYNGTKAFIDSFSFALRAELKDSGVTVTCLMPGATETDFFARADMLDTAVGQAEKDDPGGCGEGRLRGDAARRRRRRQRLEE